MVFRFYLQLDKEGVLEKMQISLAASLSLAVHAFSRAKEARAAEAANQAPKDAPFASAPTAAATKAEVESSASPTTEAAAAVAAAAAAASPKTEDDAAPRVEFGGIFAAVAAVDAHCNEITKKFEELMRRMLRQRQHQRQNHWQRQQEVASVKPYQPLPAYARGQLAPLFPYRQTAPPPPSVLQLRERRSWLQFFAARHGSWELQERLSRANGSFSDAAWFALGCSAGRTWRWLLRQSGATAQQQLELLRLLQGDDLVEGCFVLDKVLDDRSVSRGSGLGTKSSWWEKGLLFIT